LVTAVLHFYYNDSTRVFQQAKCLFHNKLRSVKIHTDQKKKDLNCVISYRRRQSYTSCLNNIILLGIALNY
jgi:hypothetical protein